ncbi:uncharacterized protein LOC127264989 isoform X2 [Andrographis paniculata]|uniref:uncharacterized protein LOC127264989 isoform X2 n=1 Tax=Andrographis paniculata TaxID=175694 RepID=UPI0021E8641A|nr:uncharacterized protein LOC127264989 isoform X2 [Andrographis paniculata]
MDNHQSNINKGKRKVLATSAAHREDQSALVAPSGQRPQQNRRITRSQTLNRAAESNSTSMVPVNNGATAVRAERMNSPSMVGRTEGDTAVDTERSNHAQRIARVSPSEITPVTVEIPPWAMERVHRYQMRLERRRITSETTEVIEYIFKENWTSSRRMQSVPSAERPEAQNERYTDRNHDVSREMMYHALFGSDVEVEEEDENLKKKYSKSMTQPSAKISEHVRNRDDIYARLFGPDHDELTVPELSSHSNRHDDTDEDSGIALR